jgi:antitoxin (DNA-binding transcriptional repressor) of toxin-antitoxin stability system
MKTMLNLNIREMRSLLGKLDSLVEKEQELIVTRNKQAIARILPIQPTKQRPSHADLRRIQRGSEITSADLIRQDRDDR